MRFSMQLVAREALPRLVEESKSVEGEGLLQAFLEGTRRSPIDLLQFGVQIGEPPFGGLVGRLLVGPLEPGSPGCLVGLRKVTDDVSSLVPLAALDLGSLAEDLIDGLAQALRAVDDAENALLESKPLVQKPSFNQIPRQLYDRLRTLRGGLRKAQHLLVPGLRHAHAKGLPALRQRVFHGLRAPGSSLLPAIGPRTPPGPFGPAQRNWRLTEDWLMPNPLTNWLATCW
jgi:hypothetical protein